jgi:hypothetical protein
VRSWPTALDGSEAVSAGLLEHTIDPAEDDRYFYGAMFVVENIGSRAAKADASDHELRIFAVLAVFQEAGFPGTDPALWEGTATHSRRAFDHVFALL